MFPKIVKNKQGQYAIRERQMLFCQAYLSLRSGNWWLTPEYHREYHADIWSSNLELVVKKFNRLKTNRQKFKEFMWDFAQWFLGNFSRPEKVLKGKNLAMERAQQKLMNADTVEK